ncbi:glycosyltransferase family 39 protein [Paenibacillus sp. WLX2291]|uniref:glycosyltransferase family 39 protein n=1 Tax=Paenibacillus sp. WLX2291 TaxID=3296934 RepID=UPI003983DB23
MEPRTTTVSRVRVDIPLILILILSAFLNIWNIWDNGNANSYYTAAITSMLQSFHNFFYASFDPAGFVTIDKPPVAFWIQTLFAAIFGVHGWSVTLPAALAGVGSVGLLYAIVKPTFGLTAARVAALFMAITPVAVAVQRSNNVDGILVFTLLLASWMLLKGVRLQKIGWIVGGFAMIGVAFNEKMLQAYMILPALYLFYLLAYKVNWKKKLSVLVLGTIALAGVSLSWPVIVDSVPADQRPYIGSSQTNSVLELAFGYNGVSRLTGETQSFGNMGGGGGMPGMTGTTTENGATATGTTGGATSTTGQTSTENGAAGNAMGAGMQGGNMQPPGGSDNGRRTGGMFNTGEVGPFRLFQKELSGQASLLLPFAIISLIALFAGVRRNNWRRLEHTEIVFWLMWLIPVAGFFSIANFFHQYYLIMLAPPVAAIAAAGLVAQWRYYCEGKGWLSWLLPISVLLTAAFQLYVIYPYRNEIASVWFYLIAALGIIATVALIVVPRVKALHNAKTYVVSGAIGALLLTPLYWSSFPLMNPSSNIALPYGGPVTEMGFGGGGGNRAGGMGMGNGQRQPGMNNGTGATTGTENGMGTGMNGTGTNGAGTNGTGTTGNGGMNGNDGMTAPTGTPPGGTGTGATGGGTTRTGGTRGGGMGMGESVNEKLLTYVTENNTGEKYLFAVSNSNSASSYIIKTGKAVMAMGGYSGSDPILTLDKLKALIKAGEIKYFLLGGMGRGGSSDITEWIEQNGTEVPSSEWEETTTSVVQNALSGKDSTSTSDTSSTIANGMNRTDGMTGGFGGFGMMSNTLYEITPEDVTD